MKTDGQIHLGRFIRSRKRKDGTDHVFMSVPSRLRPAGWPETITLPEGARRPGSLDDPRFLERVLKDARRLNERLDARRDQERIYQSPGHRNARKLAEIYFRTQRYRDLSESRKYRNKRDAMIFVAWSEGRGDPEFTTLMKPDFEDFLSLFEEKKASKIEFRSILNVLCTEAVEAGWRPDNPVRKLSWTAPALKEQVVLWTDADVAAYAKMARDMKQPGLAALIEVGMYVGQRLGDLRTARHGMNFVNGRLRIKQSKTGEKVNLPLPRHLCDLIESVRISGSDYLFNDGDTGTGFTESRLGLRFVEVRHALTAEGAPKLVLRSLRHSAVCRMIDAGIPLRQISAVTGHRLGRVQRIVERYAIDQEGFGAAAMMKLHKSRGGSDDDFDLTDPGADQDWDADGAGKPIYRAPAESAARPGRWIGPTLGQHRLAYNIPADLIAWPDSEVSDAAP